MPTQTNQLSGLYLHLGPENSPAYEVECGCKNIHAPTIPDADQIIRTKCPHCNGTGHVMKRVVGSVEVEHCTVPNDDWCGFKLPNSKSDYLYSDELDLVDAVIEMYRDGSLPEAVRERLREEDADAD